MRKMEPERLMHVSKATQLVSGRANLGSWQTVQGEDVSYLSFVFTLSWLVSSENDPINETKCFPFNMLSGVWLYDVPTDIKIL